MVRLNLKLIFLNLNSIFFIIDHGHSHASSGSHMHVPQEEVIIIGNSLSHDSKGAIVLNNGMKHANGTSSQNGGDEIANPQNQLPQQQTQKRQSRNMNMHGVFLHVLADALGSVIVIISALVVQYTDWKYNIYVDPGLSVIMVIIIAHSTLPLRKCFIVIYIYQLIVVVTFYHSYRFCVDPFANCSNSHSN